ncbi:MAG: AAA family ATPase [Anaerolineales bacterium]|nr:AAA family ATPase [Anaerolineales bacterium]
MYLITRVEIEGFWGKYKIETDLHPDVNIFIGKNGTGKTTFINMLYAVLKVDLRTLLNLEFKKITILLRSEKSKTKKISVTKSESSESAIQNITYKLANKSYPFSISARDVELIERNMRRHSLISESLFELGRKISDLINISNLSVHRATSEYTNSPEDEFRASRRIDRPNTLPIDQRLNDLIGRLKGYQLILSKQADEISSNLQKDVLRSMLYNPNFDTFSLSPNSELELGKEKQELTKAYKELGALDEPTKQKIDKHIRVLNQSLASIRKAQDSKDQNYLRVDDIMPMSLLKRTQHVIDLALKAEQNKQNVFQLINLFLQTINEFIKDKDVSITANGDLEIKKGQKVILSPTISNISSGEKQLLILLTETLLQKSEPFIFFADEPELSLHIEWQAQIIPSIKKLNDSAQIIVATHSPEIAAGRKKNLISMEKILHE